MNRLIFLGSGGGRGMMRTQERSTAGIYVELGSGLISETSDNIKFCLDPGPGTLVRAVAAKLQPEKWNGLLLSHLHVDQSADANSLLDVMVHNKAPDKFVKEIRTSQPFLVAERHCIEPKGKKEKIEEYYPCITVHHQDLSKLYAMQPGKIVKVNGMEITSVLADHYFPTLGFVLKHNNLKIGFTSDGSYYAGMEKHFNGCNLLVINTAVPMGMDTKPHFHMGVKDAITLLRNIEEKPQLVVLDRLTPFITRANIWKQTKIVQEATKIRTINSEDGMEISLDNLNAQPKIIKI